MARVDPIQFIERACRLKIRTFQRDWLKQLYVEEDGKRKYSSALLGLPRGNGKTALGAGIALKMLMADTPKDGEPAEVYVAAGSIEQARELFKSAQHLVRNSPLLEKYLIVQPGYKRIKFGDSFIQIISAEGPLQHGLRPSAVLFDEVWNQKRRELWEALVGGLIKRPEPLLVCISSAGYDQDSLLWELCKRGEAGTDPRFFYQWHSAPEDLDYADPATWLAANPAMACEDPFLHPTGLEDSLQRMHESEFRRWHLGQWTSAENSWMSAATWDACSAAPEIPANARPVAHGVDASISHDSTAVCTVFRDPEGTYHARFKVWIPSRDQDVDLPAVTAYLREQLNQYPGSTVVYDKQYFVSEAQRLEQEGFAVVEWPQDNARMVPATMTLSQIVKHQRLRHGGDAIARQHALAAAVVETERGLRIKKTASRQRNDCAVALAMAVEHLAREPELRRSVYEDRPLMLA